MRSGRRNFKCMVCRVSIAGQALFWQNERVIVPMEFVGPCHLPRGLFVLATKPNVRNGVATGGPSPQFGYATPPPLPALRAHLVTKGQ